MEVCKLPFTAPILRFPMKDVFLDCLFTKHLNFVAVFIPNCLNQFILLIQNTKTGSVGTTTTRSI